MAARRAGRLGDGFFPGTQSIEDLGPILDLARTSATEHGRDADALELSAGGATFGPNAVDGVKALEDLGVDRVMVPSFVFWGDPAADLARYGEDVISKF